MSTTYELGISSATAIQLYPDWNYKAGKKQIRNQHRTRQGGLYIYKWSDYPQFKFSVDIVPAADAAIINSWWDTNTELLFFVTSGGVTEVNSVLIVNDESPMDQRTKPYDNYWKGAIQLEGY